MAADAAKDAQNAISRYFDKVTKSNSCQQVLIGAASGFITGFLSLKAGKVVAVSAGGGIILLQLASNEGIIKVNYDKVHRRIDKVVDKVEQTLTGKEPSWYDGITRFTRRNGPFVGGFIGGLLLGVGVAS